MSNSDRSSSARTATLHCRPACVVGGGDPATWSKFPATQTVNLGCNDLSSVSSVRFCDGTYMGPGGSFDISSTQNIDITSISTISLTTTSADANINLSADLISSKINLTAIAGGGEINATGTSVNISSITNLNVVAGATATIVGTSNAVLQTTDVSVYLDQGAQTATIGVPNNNSIQIDGQNGRIDAMCSSDIGITANNSLNINTLNGATNINCFNMNVLAANDGINISTINGGYLTGNISGAINFVSANAVNITATDGNLEATSGADVSISSTHPTGIVTLTTNNTVVTLNEVDSTVNITSPGGLNITSSSALLAINADPTFFFTNTATTTTGQVGLASSGQVRIQSSVGGGNTFLDIGTDISLYSQTNGVYVQNEEGNFKLFRPAYGSFSSSVTQPTTVAGVGITYNTTDINQSITYNTGIPSQIICQFAGKYRIMYSVQLDKASGAASVVNIWLKLNGTAVPKSNSRSVINGPNDSKIAVCEYILTIGAGGNIEVFFASTDITSSATAYAASGAIPATPSIITTINRIA